MSGCFLSRTKGLDAKVLSTKAIFLGGSGDRVAGADHNTMSRVPGAASGAQLLMAPMFYPPGVTGGAAVEVAPIGEKTSTIARFAVVTSPNGRQVAVGTLAVAIFGRKGARDTP